jgi:DNA ligase (NAD+)
MREIKTPTDCPSCNSTLQWQNHLLYCKNTSCGSQLEKKIQHFAKSLKIKGLGPRTIEKLALGAIEDLYWLTGDDIADCLNSDRLAEKLVYEIENSKKAPMNKLLPAFSIPLIGNTASTKLSAVCQSVNDINEDSCKTAGLGPKATLNLLTWIENDFPSLEDLPFSFEFEQPKVAARCAGIVCISGRLKSFKTKAEAKNVLEGYGYIVKSSLTKEVQILVNESGVESAKTKQATNSGLLIVTNLKDFIEEL